MAAGLSRAGRDMEIRESGRRSGKRGYRRGDGRWRRRNENYGQRDGRNGEKRVLVRKGYTLGNEYSRCRFFRSGR